MPDQVMEWQRLVADAIILERAAMVLERRGNGGFTVLVLIRALRRMADRLRVKAGADHA